MASVAPVPRPPGDPASADYPSLTVAGVDVPVVGWTSNGGGFDYAHASVADGPVELLVTARQTVASRRVSPLRDQIASTAEGASLRLTVTAPGYYAIRVNSLRTLLLFLDPLEATPLSGDPGVADLTAPPYSVPADGSRLVTTELNQALADRAAAGGGVVLLPAGLYRAGTVYLQPGVELHLAAGALLKASDNLYDLRRGREGDPAYSTGPYERRSFLTGHLAHGASVRGRGTIDGNGLLLRDNPAYPYPARNITGRPGLVNTERANNLQFTRSRGVRIEGVVSRDSTSWNTIPYHCDDLSISRYKVLSRLRFINEDGIDPDSCVRLRIEDSFVMAGDDAIVLKNCGSFNGQAISPDGGSRTQRDVLVRGNLLWSANAPLKFGFAESEAGETYDVSFEDNVALSGREGVQIRSGGPWLIRDVRFVGNHYESVSERAIWFGDLADNDFQRVLFIDERWENPGAQPSILRGADHFFRDVLIGGAPLAGTAGLSNFASGLSFSNRHDAPLIIDNGAAGYSESGAWSSSSQNTDRIGADYRHEGAGVSSAWAQWAPSFPSARPVEIALYWSAHSNRPDAAPVEIRHAGGTTWLTVNQQNNGNRWNTLGTFTLGPDHFVRIHGTDDGFTIADAARFVSNPPEAVDRRAPSPTPDTFVLSPGESLLTDLLANDLSSRPPLQLLALNAPAGDSAVLGEDGRVRFSAGNAAGTRRFTYTVSDAGGRIRWADVNVRTLSPLEAWRRTHFATPDALHEAADDADPDADGVPNLLEYALGGAPRTPDAATVAPSMRVSSSTERRLILRFLRSRAELRYEVEQSSDLRSWRVIATDPGTPGDWADVSSVIEPADKLFLRLRVSLR